MANCKVHNLDPEKYLEEVIRRLPERPTSGDAVKLTPAAIAKECELNAAEEAAIEVAA